MNVKQALLGLAVLVLAAPAARAQQAALSGFVTDAATGETLLLANVVLTGTVYGAATNTAGYYTLTALEPGTYTLVASYLGYRERRQEIMLAPGERRRLDLALAPDDVAIGEVVVEAEREGEAEARNIGVAQLPAQQVKALPTVFEADVFRALQLLPGVKASSDFSSGLYIRGGGPEQTLILLDRTTVYSPTHFFGFFSTFNPDAIKDVRLYKGGYPAEYGGRLGSVVDLYNKDGNRQETRGALNVGLLASRALIEGPHSDRGSYMLAVRRSTLEPLLAALERRNGVPDAYYFYDVNGKVNLEAGPRDRLALTFYAGGDVLDLPIVDGFDAALAYGNRTLSAGWTHLFSEKLFSNFTATASRYLSEPTLELAGTEIDRENNVYDVSAKGDFELIPSRQYSLKAGFWTGNFTMRISDLFDGRETLAERIRTLYGAAYVQGTYRPAPRWELQAGLRANYFERGRYARLEPRLSLEHRPTADLRLQLGYGRYHQFLSLISGEISGFDIWITTAEGVRPAYGDQFVAGAKASVGRGINLDAEVYYRTMGDLFELDPFITDAAGIDYERLFRFGEGFAYGAEGFVQKPEGRLNGFLAYTFGVTRRRFEGFENGALFAPKHDRTHDVNLVANYDLGRTWRLTGVLTYATGQAYTEPDGQYRFADYPFASTVKDAVKGGFNEARLPAYHRLDLGLTKQGRLFGFADYELQLQVINAYGRRNVWFYFFDFEDDGAVTRRSVPQIPFPVPNLALALRF